MQNEPELFQTDKGSRKRFSPGDKIDKLTIVEYLGKRKFKSGQSHDPVYKCKCDCGNDEIRSQQYLISSKIKRRFCSECGRNESRKGAARGGKRKHAYYTEIRPNDYISREEQVHKILHDIWKFDPDMFSPTSYSVN